jgi:hypothetical protein
MPPMSPMEREFWLIDQEINWRGLGIDRAGVRACIIILNQAIDRYGEEMRAITAGSLRRKCKRLSVGFRLGASIRRA